MRFCKGIDPLQRVLPHMPLHHLSVHTRPETFCPSRTPLAGLAFTAVLPVPLARRGLPGQPLLFWADVFVADWIIAETVLPVVRSFVCVPSVANYPLYPLRLQQMRYPCVVVSRVQSHVLGQLPKSSLHSVEYFGHRRHVVDVCRFHMHVYDYIALAVHGAVFAVVKPVRFPIPALLSALRVCPALHPRGAPAALVRVVIPVKRLLPQFLTFLIYLRVQFAQICLRRDRYFHLLLLVLVRLRLDVRRIRIQDCSAYQPLRLALSQNFFEDLFRDVVVPESPATILTDRRRVRRLVCQIQPAKPLVGDVVVDLFLQPRLALDPVQIPHQQRSEQYFRVDGRPDVVRAIQRRAQIVDETEVHRAVHLPQKVILRHHLFHDHRLHLLLLLLPLLEHLFHRLVFFLVVLM